MSRHTSRKARWTQINAKEYRAAFGVVCYKAGAWEAMVHYEAWNSESQPAWQAEQTFAGRYKRPRNAMMAVEDKAREILRQQGERVRIAFAE